jgi:hypothetical protein
MMSWLKCGKSSTQDGFSWINCRILDDYSFDASENVLTIRAGGLDYVANRVYQVLVQTTYLGTDYYQIIQLNVQNVNSVPSLTLR